MGRDPIFGGEIISWIYLLLIQTTLVFVLKAVFFVNVVTFSDIVALST